MPSHILTQNRTLQQGRYTIRRKLGAGGFGITYLAYDEVMDIEVAIKELFVEEYCRRQQDEKTVFAVKDDEFDYAQAKADFWKEARLLRKLKNPHIVSAVDVFQENNTVYMVMDYIEGQSLHDLIQHSSTRSEWSQFKIWLNQISQALTYLHRNNFYHLDIKPSNVMINAEDQSAILIDFGLCKHIEVGTKARKSRLGYSRGYSAPELITGEFTEMQQYVQLDIYALGATIYYLLLGEHPENSSQIKRKLQASDVDPYLQNAIIQATHKNPIRRQKNVREFTNILKHTNESLLPVDKEDPYKTQFYPPPPSSSSSSGVIKPFYYGAATLMLMLLIAAFTIPRLTYSESKKKQERKDSVDNILTPIVKPTDKIQDFEEIVHKPSPPDSEKDKSTDAKRYEIYDGEIVSRKASYPVQVEIKKSTMVNNGRQQLSGTWIIGEKSSKTKYQLDGFFDPTNKKIRLERGSLISGNLNFCLFYVDTFYEWGTPSINTAFYADPTSSSQTVCKDLRMNTKIKLRIK